MEQGDLISFTSVVAGLLLCKRCITSSEIINFTSKLCCEGFEIEDDWNIDELLICVDMNYQYSFILKENLSYDSILYDNVTVRGFLESYISENILNVIQKDPVYGEMYLRGCRVAFKEPKLIEKLPSNKHHINFFGTKDKVSYSKVRRRKAWYSFLGGAH